jgi:hypothetical protein
MRLKAITVAALVLAATSVPASAAHRHHHHYHSAATSNPNGTAGGPTTLSGTGSSQYGGSTPGVTGKN